MSKSVYFDFGSGWQNVSQAIRDNIVITHRAFSNDFHKAIDEARITVQYDSAIYDDIVNPVLEILVRIEEDDVDELSPQGKLIPDYDSLKLWASFDELTGDNKHDNSGNGHVGVAVGATIIDGLTGKALTLDPGSSGRVTFPHHADYNFGAATDLSIVALFRTDSITAGDKFLIQKGAYGSSGSWGIRKVAGTHKIAFKAIDVSANSVEISSNEVINDNEFHVAIVKCNRDGSVTMWIDGNLQTDAKSMVALGSIDNASDLVIGGNDSSDTWDGDVDDCRLLARLINNDEVQKYSGSRVLFTGIIPTSRNRTYNGIQEIVMLELTAIDFSEYLAIKVNDNVWSSNDILNPDSEGTSFIHNIFTQIGLDRSYIDQTQLIDIKVACISPTSLNEEVGNLLDILLYDNGYAVNWNKSGMFAPTKWIREDSEIPTFTFDEDNIVNELETDETDKDQYEGVEVTWNEIGVKTNVLIYREPLPYDEYGGFEGYPIPAGAYYPVQTNAIDPLTGTNQVVEQQYQNTGITYLTNQAIVNQLDMNYKAFDSDFSEILKTENHALIIQREEDDAHIIVDIETYGNKSAQIRFHNTGLDFYRLYVFNIFADILYKTSERLQKIGTTDNVFSYASRFVFNTVAANKLCQALNTYVKEGQNIYSFQSEVCRPVGEFVALITNDSTSVGGLILESEYKEETNLYQYEVRGFDAVYAVIELQRVLTSPEHSARRSDAITDFISAISSDGVLTPDEKQALNLQWQSIASEYPEVLLQADVKEVGPGDPAYDNYTAAYEALDLFLFPAILGDMFTSSPVVQDDLVDALNLYSLTRQALMTAIETTSPRYEETLIFDEYGEATIPPGDSVILQGSLTVPGNIIVTAGGDITAGDVKIDSDGIVTVGTVNNVAVLSSSHGTYRLWIGNADPASATFKVTKEGVLSATGATITGTITATTGVIGGFTIDSIEGIYSGTGATRVQMKAGAGFWAGATAQVDAPFSVTVAGVLKAISGSIGGFTIDSTNGLYSGTGATRVQMKVGAGFWAGDTAQATAPFSVTQAGVLKANSGLIGGFTIDSVEGLYSGTGATRVQMKAGAGFWAGATVQGDAPFRVSVAGALVASTADVTGKITATSGVIGGFTCDVTEGLYLGTGATRVQMKAGAGFWAGATAQVDAPFSVTVAGALKSTSGLIGGFTIGSTELYAGSGATRVEMQSNGGFWAGATAFADALFSVSVAGALKANSGSIGGFTINVTAGLYSGTGATRVQMKAGAGFWAGATAIGDAPFSVTQAGVLKATNATITGTITATTGLIGGFTVAAGSLSASNFTLDSTNSRIYLGAQNQLRADATKARWSVFDNLGTEKVAMGYFDNTLIDPDGNPYTTSDYGIYVAGGNKVVFQVQVNIDGNDLVQRDGSISIQNDSGTITYVKIGTESAIVGYHLYNITSSLRTSMYLTSVTNDFIIDSADYIILDSAGIMYFKKLGTTFLTYNNSGTVVTVSGAAGNSYVLDIATDITLDSDSGIIYLYDGGAVFGSLRNSSNHLAIYDATTLAATFSGTGVTFAGDLTIGSSSTIYCTGTLTIDASTDITLDADGGDVFLKDNGVLFGTFTNSGGTLIIKSAATQVMSFSGANVTFAGTITGTLATGAQTNITSVGTLSALAVTGNVVSGALGVGTANPLTLVELSANNNLVAENNTLRFTDTDTATQTGQVIGKLEFFTSDVTNPGVAAYIKSTAFGTNGQGELLFGVGVAGAVIDAIKVTYLGRLISNYESYLVGNVGIGVAPVSWRSLYIDSTFPNNSAYRGLEHLVTFTNETLTAVRANYGHWINVDVDQTALDYSLTVAAIRTQLLIGSVTDAVSNVSIAYGLQTAANNRATGTTTTLAAVYANALNTRADAITTNQYGVYSKNDLDLGAVTTSYGIYSWTEVDGGVLDTGYGSYMRLDRDAGTAGTGYLYYGVFEGTWTTKYGLYISGETINYLSGELEVNNVTLKAAGIQFGALTATGSDLIIKSGTTTAITFSGANATFAGTITVGETISRTGDLIFDVSGDITLDADGGDIFLKDGGVTFGSLTNSSGDLIIKNGSTTVITFSGANATFAGTINTAATIARDGNLTIDVSGDITLDADGGDITFADGGASLGSISASTGWSMTKAIINTTLTLAAFPYCQLGRITSTVIIVGDGSWVSVPMNSEDADTHNRYNTTTGEFIAPSAGLYLFCWSVLADSASWGSNTVWSSGIFVDGSLHAQGYRTENCTGGTITGYLNTTGSKIIYLAASASVYLKVQQNSGTNKNVWYDPVHTWMTITKLPSQYT